MNMRKTMIASAIAGTLGLGFAGQASASLYGGDSLTVSNLKITLTKPIDITSYSFSTTTSATLNSSSSSGSDQCASATGGCPNTDPVIIAGVANSPANSGYDLAARDYTLQGPSATYQYASAGSEITTSEITSGNANPTALSGISEAELQSTGAGDADTSTGSTTTFTTQFVAGSTFDFTLAFDVAINNWLEQNTVPPSSVLTSTAYTNTLLTFSLGNGTDIVQWQPDGTANDYFLKCIGTGVSCTETADDTLNLNGGDYALYPPNTSPAKTQYTNNGSGGVSITGLGAGIYTLTLTAKTLVHIDETTVPEPGTLLLLGGGLLGFGAMRRKSRGGPAQSS
jgi:hypothetical protein